MDEGLRWRVKVFRRSSDVSSESIGWWKWNEYGMFCTWYFNFYCDRIFLLLWKIDNWILYCTFLLILLIYSDFLFCLVTWSWFFTFTIQALILPGSLGNSIIFLILNSWTHLVLMMMIIYFLMYRNTQDLFDISFVWKQCG